MSDDKMSLIEELQNPPRLSRGRLDEGRVIDLMRIAASALSTMIGVAAKASRQAASQGKAGGEVETNTDVAQHNMDRAPAADEATGDAGSNPVVGALSTAQAAPDGWPDWFPASPADIERGDELFIGGYTWTLHGEDGPKEYKFREGRWYRLNGPVTASPARIAERLADVVIMLDAPDAYNREYIAAVCRSILSPGPPTNDGSAA